MAAPSGAAFAQATPRTLAIRTDNDAFDFWMRPWNRPDYEYTSGVHITYDGGDAPRWARPFLDRTRTCVTRMSSCRAGRLELGQDIYTRDGHITDSAQLRIARPSAGWLYLAQSARALHENRAHDLTIALGVTGKPSLAQLTQRLAHAAAPAFNRPTDWSRQISFEPGVIVRYDHRRRAAMSAGALGVDLIPRIGASVGNVLTAAEAGLQVRTGWHLPHPWLPSGERAAITLLVGATAQAIGRNMFLDGNTFRDGPRVGHETFVGLGEAGIELRYRWLTAAYRAVSESRAYAAGPKWHPWASMVGAVSFAR